MNYPQYPLLSGALRLVTEKMLLQTLKEHFSLYCFNPAFIKIDFVADEWNRAVCLEQLPQSADEADVKEIFPKATKIHLTKTTKGMR